MDDQLGIFYCFDAASIWNYAFRKCLACCLFFEEGEKNLPLIDTFEITEGEKIWRTVFW